MESILEDRIKNLEQQIRFLTLECAGAWGRGYQCAMKDFNVGPDRVTENPYGPEPEPLPPEPRPRPLPRKQPVVEVIKKPMKHKPQSTQVGISYE